MRKDNNYLQIWRPAPENYFKILIIIFDFGGAATLPQHLLFHTASRQNSSQKSLIYIPEEPKRCESDD